MIEIINLACTKIEGGLYMGAEEKYCCYRSLPYLLLLLDGGEKKVSRMARERFSSK